jgi:hypothetical protein
VRAVRSHGKDPDLVSNIKSLLRPLWASGSAKDK